MSALPLSMSQKRAVSRQCAVGIPATEIAATFSITVRDVQRIDMAERQKSHDRRRRAEPLPGPRIPTWKTARPAEERIRRGEPCRSPECSGTVERGSYCNHCAGLMYAKRAA